MTKMGWLYCIVGHLPIISAFWIIGSTQANFNMQISKRYDHYFFHLYHNAFISHMNDVSKNQNLELELENYAKENKSSGIVKDWFKFDKWKFQLHQHFLFAARIAKESTDPFQLLIYVYVKHQAYLKAITYMNGAIILPEKDDRRKYCRAIAIVLLNFSDIGMNDIFKKLHAVLKIMYGNALTNKINKILEMWATAAYMIWSKFVPLMKSDNSSNNIGEHYQKVCADENEIMIETRIAMMTLFEGIKQGVVGPSLPPKERLTLNFAAALNFWDKSRATSADHFEISKDKFQLIEMMVQYDKEEMRLYGELYDIKKEVLNFDDLKNLNSLIFHERTGAIKLVRTQKETASCITGNAQANFNMLISKKYDHYFLDLYQTAFANHLNDVNKNPNLELDLLNYAKEKQSRGIVREWFKIENLEPMYFKHLRQHFLFGVRIAKESTDPFQLLIFIYVKYQAYLRAIIYMNGTIILPEKDDRRNFCKVISIILLNFSDVATIDIFEKLHVSLQRMYGSALTNKIRKTLEMWIRAAFKIWEKFVPQMISGNTSTNIGELYEKLCTNENEILIEARIAMMSLFEGIKQGVVKSSLPPKERLTLNFATAFKLWDMSRKTWDDHFDISKDKFQVKEMMVQHDIAEMRMYGELNNINIIALNFDHLKNFTVLVFDETTGVIKLSKTQEEIDTDNEILTRKNI